MIDFGATRTSAPTETVSVRLDALRLERHLGSSTSTALVCVCVCVGCMMIIAAAWIQLCVYVSVCICMGRGKCVYTVQKAGGWLRADKYFAVAATCCTSPQFGAAVMLGRGGDDGFRVFGRLCGVGSRMNWITITSSSTIYT